MPSSCGSAFVYYSVVLIPQISFFNGPVPRRHCHETRKGCGNLPSGCNSNIFYGDIFTDLDCLVPQLTIIILYPHGCHQPMNIASLAPAIWPAPLSPNCEIVVPFSPKQAIETMRTSLPLVYMGAKAILVLTDLFLRPVLVPQDITLINACWGKRTTSCRGKWS
mgnify:CR=1 FL=1